MVKTVWLTAPVWLAGMAVFRLHTLCTLAMALDFCMPLAHLWPALTRDAAALLAHAYKSPAASGVDYQNNAKLGAFGSALPPLTDAQVIEIGWTAPAGELAATWTRTVLHGGGYELVRTVANAYLFTPALM